MSSSDYTNLRRLRHVYYPSLNNCHSNVQTSHQHIPHAVNNCYIDPHVHSAPHVHTAQHMQPPPHMHAEPDVHNHIHNTNTAPTNPPPTVVYPQPPSHGHSGGYPGGPMSIVNYPPVIQSQTPICNNNNNNNSSCGNCNTGNNQLIPNIHETNYIYPQPPVYYSNNQCVANNDCVLDKTTMSMTKKEYLITPTYSGSITFSIDCYLGFVEGAKVNCTSDASANNYFEGVIYNYEGCTGEITIYNLAVINGSFDKQSKYLVSIIPAFQEIDLLRDRMARVYLALFNEDISDKPTVTNDGDDNGDGTLTDAIKTQTSAVFTYFFNEDITSDSNYTESETYYTQKVELLYEYFFGNTTANPNNNGVTLDTLEAKIEQLNLYFFNSATPSITTN